MSNGKPSPALLRHGRPSPWSSASSGSDPFTLQWVQLAHTFVRSRERHIITLTDLAVALEVGGLLKRAGTVIKARRPGWFLDQLAEAFDLNGTYPPPVKNPSFENSLSPEIAQMLRVGAPIKLCFDALTKDHWTFFSELFELGPSIPANVGELLRRAQALADALEAELRGVLIGQSAAVDAMKRLAFRMVLSEDKEKHPATALFMGPPGCGKTSVAKCLARVFDADLGELSVDARPLLEVDMTQHVEWSSGVDLFGNTLKTGTLSSFVAQHPTAIIICNEFEKAHPKVLEAFLPILDQGFLASAGSHPIDFRRSVFVFTSNLGADYWSRSDCPEEHSFTIDPLDLAGLSEKANDKSPGVSRELLSRLGKGVVVLFRRHAGHHFLEKMRRSGVGTWGGL